MVEYKVEVLAVKKMEERMNELAKEGWRVVTQSPNIARMYGVIVTFIRER